jgi:hypothetical protein
MKKLAYTGAAFLLPMLAMAQTTSSFQKLGGDIITIINNVLVPLIFALAFLVFIFGVFQYFILGGADAEKRESGKGLMIWGLIGFFVMVSVWGLVNLFVGTFDLNNRTPGGGDLPRAPGVRN